MKKLSIVALFICFTILINGCANDGNLPNPKNLLADTVNSYQAEDGQYTTLFGDAAINYGKNHVGKKKVGWLGNGQGMIMFTFNRLQGGEYNMFIHYESGEERLSMIKVNDQEANEYVFPSLGTWDTVGVLSIKVTLEAGENNITFYHDTEYCPDLDFISFDMDTRDNLDALEPKKETVVFDERSIESTNYTVTNEGTNIILPQSLLTYEDIEIDVEDHYYIEVFYSAQESSSIRLHYDDGVKYLTLLPSENNHFSSAATVIYMKPNINTITLSHQFGNEIEISMIKISNLNTPVAEWGFNLSNKVVVPNNAKIPTYPWYPDGHISVLADGEGGYMMYWAEYKNYRTVSDSVFPAFHTEKVPETPVMGGRGNWDSYDNGGLWLMSVHRINDQTLIGYYHAEDHWYPHESNDVAWKSIGVAYSYDNGFTWEDEGLILTSNEEKPDTPVWGGIGDNCVVWDDKEDRWVAVYQKNILRSAISYDALGKPGTWMKYNDGSYQTDGLGGLDSPQPGLSLIPGGNPSIHFNYYLNKWVIVWHGWDPGHIYMSISDDLVDWEEPKIIVEADGDWRRSWYPTIIGISDVLGGKYVKIYYADLSRDFSNRLFTEIEIEFLRNSEVKINE